MLARTLDPETLADVLVRRVPQAMHLPGAALRALARDVTSRGLPVEVHLEDVSLPDGIAIGLYRICQEALSNAWRHAEA